MVGDVMIISMLFAVYLLIGFVIAIFPLDYDDPEEVMGVALVWPIILVALALIRFYRVIADTFNRR